MRRKPIWLLILPSLLACQEKTQQAPEPTSRDLSPETVSPPAPRSEPAPAEAQTKQSSYNLPEQTREEVSAGLTQICKSAQDNGGRFLIEFSAAWCGDCRTLAELKQEAVLKDKLAAVPHFTVNVGRFDHHQDLLDEFRVRSIARWQIVETNDCASAPSAWKKLERRTLEPRTGKKLTADELAEWLSERFKNEG